MLFNSFTYLLFLPLVVALHWALPRAYRPFFLLLASYVFYMHWMPGYGLLILALTISNYFLGRAIAAAPQDGKKPLLISGLIFNLATLCFFKYANFILATIWQTGVWTNAISGLPADIAKNSPALNIILPLGISFFVFEFIHYIVDVYRGSQPMRNFWHFALFAAFFPSQIAGPIKRFQDFAKQLLEENRFSNENFRSGISLIFLGLYKKMVLGDNLGHVVNVGFNTPAVMGTVDAWIAAVGFTIQIYLDFSGYTDIGRASALLLGYKLPINFNWPFLAASLNEFWRRWHISLSTWLRDYLFIPLGGSRVGSWKLKRNLMVTMALGGLWHGSDWHYVIWGLFHGTGLVLTKDWQDLVAGTTWLKRLRSHQWWHWSGVASTFVFLIFACVIFRAEDVPKALSVFARMFALAPSSAVLHSFAVSTLPFSLPAYAAFLTLTRLSQNTDHALAAKTMIALRHWWRSSVPLQAATYACLGLTILAFAPEDVAPFIYFQF